MSQLALSSQSRDCRSNLDTWTQLSVSLVITRKISPSLLVDNNNNNNSNDSIWVCLKIRAFPTTKWYIIIFSDIYIYIPYHVQAYLDASAATPVPAPVPAASHIFQRPISSVVGRVKRLATRSARLMPGPTWAEAPGWPGWRGNIFQNQRVWLRFKKIRTPWVLHSNKTRGFTYSPMVLLLFQIILWDFGSF